MRAVNLIPSDQRSGGSVGAGRSEGAAYAVLAMLVVVAALALLYGKANREVDSSKAKAATLTAEAQRAEVSASALAPYSSFVALREQREQAVSALVDTRFDWAHAIHEFGRVLSNQVSISSLDGTIASSAGATAATPAPAAPSPAAAPAASASVTSATPSGSVPTFQISGCASSQHAVADTMQRLRLIDGVSEVTLQSSVKANSGAGAASSSAAGAGAACTANAAVFQMTVTFQALPAASTSAAAATASSTNVSNPASAPSATGAATAASPGGKTE